MIETDDPEALRKEILAVLEKVTVRGSLLFFHWILRRISNNDPLPADEELKGPTWGICQNYGRLRRKEAAAR